MFLSLTLSRQMPAGLFHWWLDNIRETDYNTFTSKFDSFSEFQNVTSDSPPPANVIMMHCVRNSICDSPLTSHLRCNSNWLNDFSMRGKWASNWLMSVNRGGYRTPVHSTWWKYSTSWKFSLHFVYIFRTSWNFLI